MRYDYILFDLDGTLTNPGLGITNSVMHALKKLGIEPPERRELYKFIGPPLRESFARYFDLSPEHVEEAVEYYREHHADIGLFENELYPGIPALLAELSAGGATLLVASSKPEVYVRRILEHFGQAGRFAVIAGSLLDGRRENKAEVIEYALETGGVADRLHSVMIGDREHDIFGAKKCGLDSIGVLYGYGSRDELVAAGADAVAASVEELRGLLLA